MALLMSDLIGQVELQEVAEAAAAAESQLAPMQSSTEAQLQVELSPPRHCAVALYASPPLAANANRQC